MRQELPLYVCDDMGALHGHVDVKTKLYTIFCHKEKHTDVHTEAICHLGVGGPGGVHCVSSGSEKRIQFLVLQKKGKKKCVCIYAWMCTWGSLSMPVYVSVLIFIDHLQV